MENLFCSDEAFIKKEREKARKLRSSQWWKRKRSTGICQYCEKTFIPGELTMDHIIPLSRGGKSVKYNLAPCCKECNTNKKQLLPIEWEEYMGSLKK
ncbi:MAG: HNH endonuclease [Desulfobacula sp.]|nr:HNH endonuclease [Desulfobacula sp.]